MNSNKLIKVGFGGGCHWCTEAVFQAVKGVFQVQQGYLSALEESEVFYEGIILKYDPDLIQMKTLIAIHLKTHQSASNHSRRDGYLSAVYVFNEQQKLQVNKILKMFQKKYSSKFITQAIMFGKFEESREQIQNYYLNDPERPFCKRYIEPKIELLEKEFKNSIR